VAFIILLGVVSYGKASKGMIENYENTTIVNLDMMSEYFELGLNNISGKAIQVITDETIQRYYSQYYSSDPTEEVSRFSETDNKINAITAGDKFITDTYVFADYGNTVATAGVLRKTFFEEFNKSEDAIGLFDTSESQIWVGTHHFIDSAFPNNKAEYCLSFMKKIKDTSFYHIGYIVIDIDKAFVKDILDKTNFGDGSIVGFVTNDGKAVLNGSNVEGFDVKKETFYTKALENTSTLGSEYVTFKDESYLFMYSKLEVGNSTIFALIPKSEVVKQANSVRIITVIIVIIASLVALFTGILLAAGIGSTIQKTNKTLAIVATGDLSIIAGIGRKDEFHLIGKSINDMINSMKTLINRMHSVSKRTAISADNVDRASKDLLMSSKSIATSVADIEQGAQQQAQDAEKCLLQMSDLAGQINMIQESTRENQQIAINTKALVKDGLFSMNDLNTKAKDTSDITQIVITNIESLETESKSIIGIIEAINDITEQTNLLSLNASIEAARAGVAGRGFAVVAEEIRKLAERSSSEARRIGKIIERIQDRTRATVKAARKAEDIVAVQESTVDDTMKKFTAIELHVVDLTDNLTKISLGIEKIGQAKDDTLIAIESISSTLEEIAASSTELGVTVEKQLDSVKELNNEAAQLGDDAKNMEETVHIFHVE